MKISYYKNSLFFLILLACQLGYSQEIKITEINYEGLKKLKPHFVSKITSVKVGSKLDSTKIKNDLLLLQTLPAVGKIDYEVLITSEACKVTYLIQENFTIIPSFNVFTSVNGEFAFRAGVSEFNLLGESIAIGGFYQRDIYNSFKLNFMAPFLFSSKTGIGITYQNLVSQEPVFFPAGTVDFKYTNNSLEVLGLHQLNSKNKISLGLNVFSEIYEYKPKPTDVTPPIKELKEYKKLYKFMYEYTNVHFNYHLLSGLRNVFNYQYVTTQKVSELPEFSILINDFLYYKQVGEKGNWASRFRIGIATNNNSPFAPFAVDNNINIRGVGNIIDRGTAALVFNTEYRYDLFEKKSFVLQGNAFIDSGTWRNPGGDIEDFVQSENIKLFSGLGLRFVHKKIFNAVFRIDYGISLNQPVSGLVFGIGQYF